MNTILLPLQGVTAVAMPTQGAASLALGCGIVGLSARYQSAVRSQWTGRKLLACAACARLCRLRGLKGQNSIAQGKRSGTLGK